MQVTRNVLKAAIGAAEETGIGLAFTSRNTARRIIMGVHDVGGDIVAAADDTFRCAAKEASKVGGDVARIAKAASYGVIESIGEVRGNLEQRELSTNRGLAGHLTLERSEQKIKSGNNLVSHFLE